MEIESKIQKNVSLAPRTTFKIGGPAKFYIETKTKEDFSAAFEWAEEKKEKVFILAGGSNVLINDQGVNGLVIKMSNDEIKLHGDRMECGAGASLSRAVTLSTSNNLSGLEWGIGIPQSSVGGAVWGNAGAFGNSMGDVVETVEAYNIKRNGFEFFSRKDCEFAYRESFFKRNSGFLIWKINLKLVIKEKKEILAVLTNNMEFRNTRQPKLPSAGSVFKNINFSELKNNNPDLAKIARDKEKIKGEMVGAAWLIDMAGLKGKAIGGAKISLEHANFIINTGGATADNVAILISFIKQQIRDKYKIELQEEVQYLGF